MHINYTANFIYYIKFLIYILLCLQDIAWNFIEKSLIFIWIAQRDRKISKLTINFLRFGRHCYRICDWYLCPSVLIPIWKRWLKWCCNDKIWIEYFNYIAWKRQTQFILMSCKFLILLTGKWDQYLSKKEPSPLHD